jgi:hypothetical protein
MTPCPIFLCSFHNIFTAHGSLGLILQATRGNAPAIKDWINGEPEMKQLYLFGVAPTLILLAILGAANAELVVDDGPSFASAAEETVTLWVPPSTSSLPEEVVASDAIDGPGIMQPKKNINKRKYGALPARTHANSRMDLWLLLLVAVVAGIVSEVFHHRSCNR